MPTAFCFLNLYDRFFKPYSSRKKHIWATRAEFVGSPVRVVESGSVLDDVARRLHRLARLLIRRADLRFAWFARLEIASQRAGV
jgi:hypothetical protein